MRNCWGEVDTDAAPAVVATEPVVMPAQLVLDNWVQCDKCENWRLLLPGIHTPDSSAKWNCKMMVWMPGMNNCKFTEEETTAAVYCYLDLQNLKLAPTTHVPAELPPSSTVMEPVSKKSAIQADTKKSSMATAGKKPQIDSVVMGGVKTAGSKGTADGTLKSKSLNNVGLDGNGDGISYACVLADTKNLKEKEKNKRKCAAGGEDLPIGKKVAHGSENHIQEGSTLKHLGGPNADILKGEEILHTEGNRVGRERNKDEAQVVTSISVKRKNQIEIVDEGDEIQSMKKSKGNNNGNRVLSNDSGVKEDVKAGEHVVVHKGANPVLM